MHLLSKTNEKRRWARSLRLLTVYLAGTAALGISVFSLKLSAENAVDLKPFAGTWETKHNGQVFFTLKLAIQGGSIRGTAIHCSRVAWVDGELVPGSDDFVTDKIVESRASGRRLTLKMVDENDAQSWSLLQFDLTDKDEAEAKIGAVAEGNSDAPAQEKPWHFHRAAPRQ